MRRISFLYDDELNFKSKGILVYLASCTDDKLKTIDSICLHTKEGRRSVVSGVNELIELGYFKREKSGRNVKYTINLERFV